MKDLLEYYPSHHPRVAWQIMEGQIVLVHTLSGYSCYLDGVGAQIWKKINGKTSLNEIARQLLDHYEAPLDRLQKDLLVFVKEMEEKQFIELNDPSCSGKTRKNQHHA